MATYNGERYIREQLDSILVQLSPDDEVIVSDNFSTDRTPQIVASYNDPRIRLVQHPPQGDTGVKKCINNYNNALGLAKGDIIFMADQDDYWEPEKVSVCMQYLEKYDVIVSDCRLMDGNGQIIADSFFAINRSRPGLFNNIYNNAYLGCCMCFKRAVLKKALPFPKDLTSHDTWIGFVTELRFKRIFLSDKLVRYRRHGANASRASEKRHYGWQQIMNRYHIVKYIWRAI